MATIIGLALTLVSAGASFTTALPLVLGLRLPVLVVLVVTELVMGGAAIYEFREVKRKVAALTRRRHSPTPEMFSLGGAGDAFEAPRSRVPAHSKFDAGNPRNGIVSECGAVPSATLSQHT
jgi:hypothetical protein